MERHDVEVSLAEDNVRPLRLFREVQPVEHAPLAVGQRLGRVHVFRLGLVEHAAAEADNVAPHVDHREHEPVAELVIQSALFVLHHKTRAHKLVLAVALLCHGAQETVPAIGRGAHAEAHGDAAADLSLLEIGANRRSLGTLQRLVVPARGVAVQLEHTAAELLRPAVVFLLRHGEIHPPRQKADRVRIGEVFDLHDEVDDAAALFAPEAVIELLVLQHMERGRFFIVKRAAAPVAPALARERDVSTDHVDNVVAGEQLVQKAL